MKSIRRQRGLGLVELMVGITIGLIVAAGASMVAVNQINEHRRLMLETQIQQDLRAAADLIEQDLRRAGFRGQAEQGVWAPPSGVGTQAEQPALAATPNNFAAMVKSSNSSEVSLTYLYSRTRTATAPTDADRFGVRWNKRAGSDGNAKNTLEVQIGKDNWQPITDPESLKIVDFSINIDTVPSDLGDFCDKPCSPVVVGAPDCPKHEVRRVSFKIVAEARHDANVRRTLSNVGRLRSEVVTGACPT